MDFLAGSLCSRRIDLPLYDPRVLSYLPAPGESELLEKVHGSAEQETALSVAARGDLRDSLDAASPGVGNLVERTFQGCPGNALASMLRVNVQARNPPVRPRPRLLAVSAT